ncbi:MAG: hypothetical protein H6555_03970 [Lewinellaceae bacterium]|nr:hypothetical protein [Lewinellaceae bacterium]
MYKKNWLPFSLLLAALVCFTMTANAQKPTRTTTTSVKANKAATGISDADQKAIQELFKDVDPSKYRLQFNSKRTAFGTRAVSMDDLNQIKRVTNPAEAAGYIVFVVEGDDVVYVLAVGSSKLTSVLGKEKTAKLNAIMAKYK